jgi:hypothetical protein
MKRITALAATAVTVLAAAVLTAVLLASPGAREADLGAVRPSPEVPAGSGLPSPLPTPKDGDPASCPEVLTHLTVLDGPEPTLENLSAASSATVLGKIDEIGDARFNTKDGARPAEGATLATSVVRNASVQVTAVLKGSPKTGSLDVVVLGGSIDCETWELSGQPPLEVGAEVVLFLQELPDVSGAALSEPTVVRALPVSPAGVVTPLEGTIPLAALSDLIGSN